MRALLGHVASDNAVYLLAGVALVESDHKENRAWLFAPTGALIADYAKHHLLTGLEASFTSGRDLVIRPVGTSRIGIAICKDMDSPTLGRRYAALVSLRSRRSRRASGASRSDSRGRQG